MLHVGEVIGIARREIAEAAQALRVGRIAKAHRALGRGPEPQDRPQGIPGRLHANVYRRRTVGRRVARTVAFGLAGQRDLDRARGHARRIEALGIHAHVGLTRAAKVPGMNPQPGQGLGVEVDLPLGIGRAETLDLQGAQLPTYRRIWKNHLRPHLQLGRGRTGKRIAAVRDAVPVGIGLIRLRLLTPLGLILDTVRIAIGLGQCIRRDRHEICHPTALNGYRGLGHTLGQGHAVKPIPLAHDRARFGPMQRRHGRVKIVRRPGSIAFRPILQAPVNRHQQIVGRGWYDERKALLQPHDGSRFRQRDRRRGPVQRRLCHLGEVGARCARGHPAMSTKSRRQDLEACGRHTGNRQGRTLRSERHGVDGIEPRAGCRAFFLQLQAGKQHPQRRFIGRQRRRRQMTPLRGVSAVSDHHGCRRRAQSRIGPLQQYRSTVGCIAHRQKSARGQGKNKTRREGQFRGAARRLHAPRRALGWPGPGLQRALPRTRFILSRPGRDHQKTEGLLILHRPHDPRAPARCRRRVRAGQRVKRRDAKNAQSALLVPCLHRSTAPGLTARRQHRPARQIDDQRPRQRRARQHMAPRQHFARPEIRAVRHQPRGLAQGVPRLRHHDESLSPSGQ